MHAPTVLMQCGERTNLSVGFAASSPWEGEPLVCCITKEHPPALCAGGCLGLFVLLFFTQELASRRYTVAWVS